MYADYSSNEVNGFLSDLTDQPVASAAERRSEDFSDDMILARMELLRLRASRVEGHTFLPRAALLRQAPPRHPSDLH